MAFFVEKMERTGKKAQSGRINVDMGTYFVSFFCFFCFHYFFFFSCLLLKVLGLLIFFLFFSILVKVCGAL